jgi:hypothetical protein
VHLEAPHVANQASPCKVPPLLIAEGFAAKA